MFGFFLLNLTFQYQLSTNQLMKLKFALLFAILFSLNSFSQETTNTIDNQFKSVYKKSESYLEFKIILKKEYADIHNNVLDSFKSFNEKLSTQTTLVNSQKNTIAVLTKEKKEATIKLTEELSKNTSSSLFGIQLSKGTYSFILITTIILLLIVLGYFVYKFKNSDVLTIAAKDNLEDVENEFNTFRKKALEKEQKLRRQLQDEIIKNRNN
jgi:ABC-type multidrug transport system permease subunit